MALGVKRYDWYSVEKMSLKMDRWRRLLGKAAYKGVKAMLLKAKQEIIKAYSGQVVSVRTGKTRKAIKHKFNEKFFTAKIYVDDPRAFIARFLETGTVKHRARPVFAPIEKKYISLTAKQVLKSVMKQWRTIKV